MSALLFAWWDDVASFGLPAQVALAAVAVIGYLVGRWQRVRNAETADQTHTRREMKRAQAVAKELEKIANMVRRHLAAHHASVVQFKDRVFSLSGAEHETAWQELCKEAENMLRPTLRLSTQLAAAYDEIRQQTNHLMTFTEIRTDPLTGVSNRRALDETLSVMFSLLSRYEAPFALVIVDIDHFKRLNDEQGHLYGDSVLKSVAKLLDDNVRETDVVCRYGGEEFVIIMPHTPLDGACTFMDRLRQQLADKLPVTVSGGVAAAIDGDNPQTLLARADSALYAAKAAGRNQVHFHNGLDSQRVPCELDEATNGKDESNGHALSHTAR